MQCCVSALVYTVTTSTLPITADMHHVYQLTRGAAANRAFACAMISSVLRAGLVTNIHAVNSSLYSEVYCLVNKTSINLALLN